jgi:hypothetical protein
VWVYLVFDLSCVDLSERFFFFSVCLVADIIGSVFRKEHVYRLLVIGLSGRDRGGYIHYAAFFFWDGGDHVVRLSCQVSRRVAVVAERVVYRGGL